MAGSGRFRNPQTSRAPTASREARLAGVESRPQVGAASDATRVEGCARPSVRALLARDHVGFTETARTFDSWLLPPPTSITLIINVGETFGELPAAFVAGLDDTYSVVTLGAAVSCVDVKLSPLGAYRVLGGMTMSELTGATVDLSALLGDPGRRLLESVRGAPDWSERFALLDRFLAGRAQTGPQPRPEVAHVWQRLVNGTGRVPIGALATEVGWSHKHLITKFTQQVGLAPRTLARIVRFNQILHRLQRSARPVRWSELAQACGYYDQAHLDRDFREFAGTTPTEFLTRRVPGGSLVGDGVEQRR